MLPQALNEWFNEQKRELPWREEPSPYAVWVSEVMLQQTRAAVVIPYFLRWMQRFASVEALANASVDEVIKAWEGLGYYARARNLHAGARYVVKAHGGKIPEDAEQLSRIKGLGPYTVGAIQAFAFKKRAAAVDGNVLRVMARYLGDEGEITCPSVQKRIREKAAAILPEKEPWIASEALIELGATLCGKVPQCSACPLRQSCAAYALGKTAELPKRKKRPKPERIYRIVGVVLAKQYVLVRRCGEKEIMQDLYEFPYVSAFAKEKSPETLIHSLSLPLTIEKSLPSITHTFTRFYAHLYPWVLRSASLAPVTGYQWHPVDKLVELAFSSGHRQLLFAIS